MTTPRIAIVGAGVSGLTLARVLQVRGIQSTVFELDASPQSRDQGGTLDLHRETGQAALHAAGIFDRFQSFVRVDGQETRLMDKHAKILVHDNSPESTVERPEIDRGSLRQILVDAIDRDTIHWGVRVTEIKPTSDGHRHTVVYNGGQQATFDLVVGADGAWSKVRPLLSDAHPEYSGVVFVEISFKDADHQYPQISELVGGGSCFVISDAMALIMQRNGNGSIRIYAAFHHDEDKIPELAHMLASSSEEARQYLLAKFEGWDNKLLDVFRFCDEDRFLTRPIYELRVPHVWENKPGLTLIGDAAHLMSPYAGEGANVAMWDGFTLATMIADAVQKGQPLAEAVHEFEQKMYAMSRPMVEMSAKNLRRMMTKDGSRAAIDHMNAQMLRKD